MTEIAAISSDNNIASVGTIDHSFRMASGPNEAEGVQTIDMSFGDFLDMINPLQHIPVVSAAYRAISGDGINPVPRIAGDAMYGAIMGPISAGMSALGAIADETFGAINGGKNSASTVVASLFGSDPATPAQQPIQVAQAPTTPAAPSTAPLAAAAPQNMASTPAAPVAPSPNIQLATDQGLPIDRNKPAYGGVMDSSMVQNAQQNQQIALAMAGRDNILKAQRVISSNRFGVAPTATATNAAPLATAALPMPSTSATAQPATQAAMQNLIQELQAMKNTSQYKNAAQMTPIPGGNLDITN